MNNINNSENTSSSRLEVTDDSPNLKVGSRDSELAMKQTHLIIEKLKTIHPGMTFTVESMKTLGDKILDVALSKIGSKSLFTKELEYALVQKEVDIVVHSLKDLPTTLPDGLVIGAVCSREDPSDAVIMCPKFKNKTLESLPSDSVIGTSSLRRIAQLKRRYPKLKFENIRGNLNTRLSKLDKEDKYSAIILAAAGVSRMGWKDRISQYLANDDCMYAVGQGALAIECRESDAYTLELLAPLNHYDTILAVIAERTLMKSLEGGCSVPLAVHCEIKEKKMILTGGVFSLDGSEELIDTLSSTFEDIKNNNEDEENGVRSSKVLRKSPLAYCGIVSPSNCSQQVDVAHSLGVNLANLLLKRGAKKILDEAKANNVIAPNTNPKNMNLINFTNGNEITSDVTKS